MGRVRGARVGVPGSSPSGCCARCASLGLRATEPRPDGFLPADPAQAAAALAAEGLACAGGFVPVVLHDPAHDPLPGLDRSIDQPARGRCGHRGAGRRHRCRRLRRPARPRRRRVGAAAAPPRRA
nr:hypothetical protein [Angustibacter aerolatus]